MRNSVRLCIFMDVEKLYNKSKNKWERNEAVGDTVKFNARYNVPLEVHVEYASPSLSHLK